MGRVEGRVPPVPDVMRLRGGQKPHRDMADRSHAPAVPCWLWERMTPWLGRYVDRQGERAIAAQHGWKDVVAGWGECGIGSAVYSLVSPPVQSGISLTRFTHYCLGISNFSVRRAAGEIVNRSVLRSALGL